MNKLTFTKRVIFTLFGVLLSVNLWGQETPAYYSINSCKIAGVNDYYEYTGSEITIDFSVLWDYNDGVNEDYELTEGAAKDYIYHFEYDNGETVTSVTTVNGEGFYRLVVTGTEHEGGYGGTLTKDFYVLDTKYYLLSEGSGTYGSPYLIKNEHDWIALATHSNYWASDKYIKLDADVIVGACVNSNITKSGLMVGTSENPFKGHFIGGYDETEGKYHTLTFYYTGHGIEGVPVAPFQYTNGAQFKEFNVAGEIKKYVYGSAGLIGHNVRTTTVDDVTVKLDINCGNWDGGSTVWSHRCGGFAVDGSGVEFTNCVYRGKLFTVVGDRNGGFCGKGSAKTKFINCLFCPEECDLNGVIFANGGTDYFSDYYVAHPGQDKAIGSVDGDCYYTEDRNGQSGFKQGTFAYKSVGEGGLNGEIGHKLTRTYLGVGYNLYQPITVDIDNDIYVCTGDDITPDFKLYFDGVEASTDYYTTSITGEPLHDAGDYPMTITGVHEGENGSGYYGSTTKTLKVISTTATWAYLKGELDKGGEYTLGNDFIARSVDTEPLIITNNVTINLNGHTINRNLLRATANGQVIKINSGVTVTINGPGTITGGYNKEPASEETGTIDGGGIYNMGNLTLNNVTVSGNQCVKQNQNSTDPTGRGGGIYSGQNSYLYINGCVIRDNRAQGGAGGVFVYKTKACTIGDYNDSKSTTHTSISSNNSLDKGGGIRVNGNAILNNCIISTNEVNNGTNLSVANGGGIHLDEGNLTLNKCTIDNNIASKYGGGIYAIKGTITTKDCEINYNQSYDSSMNFEGRGGGVYMHSGTFKMEGGSIRSNASNLANGGGIYLNGAILEIKSSDDKDVKINDNWTFDEDSKIKTTNVYLSGASKIKITGSLGYSTNIGVASNVGESVFTQDLDDNGTAEEIFSSDDNVYTIQGYTYTVDEEEKHEAKFKIQSPWEPEPDDPEVPGVYTINDAVIIGDVIEAKGVTIGSNGSLTIVPGGCLTTTTITNDDYTKLIIYGGQLVTTSGDVKATMKKDISAALALNGRFWYLISSGIATPTITSNTNLIKMSANDYPEYDLYRFNESVTLQWENYRNAEHADFTTLENGRGYLYRNGNDYTISISGTLNSAATITTPTLTCTGTSETNVFKGFNIIGNPYPHNIKKGDGQAIPNGDLLEVDYYVLLEEDGWTLEHDGEEIHVMEGILVQAKKDGALTISKIPVSAPASKGAGDIKASYNKIWFNINNDEFKDRACVKFKQGHGLNKIPRMNEEAPMLYVHHNNEDFASVEIGENAKSINLNFEAKTTGWYTLSVNPQGEYSYLHLIDKIAGEDIDLLVDNEYTFIGSKTDQADRFIVRLENSENAENSTFAYQSGSDIVVSGEGELQIFDVMGRLVAQKRVNGVESIDKPQTTGVYIFRLNGNTQKIVIR